MPKGVYRRTRFGVETNIEWLPEQDERLKALCKGKLSYSQITGVLNGEFPDNIKTRNAVLGRAARRGYRAMKPKPLTYGKTEAMQTTRRSNIARSKAMSPVTLLRDEGDPGKTQTRSRKLSASDPRLKERRKGYLPAIVEEQPLTSVVLSSCDKGSCMWPTSTGPTCLEVCGAEATIGSYCARHAQVAYRVMPTRKRQSLRAKEDVEHAKRIDGSQHRARPDPDGQWMTDQILASMDEVEVLGEDDGIGPLLIPFFMEKLA
jgi:hypothetical protein